MTDIAEIAARLAIQDLVARYAAAWDERDGEAFVATFAPDGVLEAPVWRAEGRAEIAAMVDKAKGRTFGSRHHVTNHRIRLLSEDRAEGDLYFFVVSQNGPDHCGRYKDTLRRQDGVWLFERRQVTVDWQNADTMWPPMSKHNL